MRVMVIVWVDNHGESMELVKTVIKPYSTEVVVSRSKFLAYIFPCSSIQLFDITLSKIKKEHPHATHHCYAFRIREQGLQERCQDDGEPSMTAGMPIMEVLKGNQITQCGIVVVRYFGGVKLGTGGLARAYGEAARLVIQEAGVATLDEAILLSFELDYSFHGKIEHFIAIYQIAVDVILYQEKINYSIIVAKHRKDIVKNELIEMTAGKVHINEGIELLGFFDKGMFIPFCDEYDAY